MKEVTVNNDPRTAVNQDRPERRRVWSPHINLTRTPSFPHFTGYPIPKYCSASTVFSGVVSHFLRPGRVFLRPVVGKDWGFRPCEEYYRFWHSSYWLTPKFYKASRCLTTFYLVTFKKSTNCRNTWYSHIQDKFSFWPNNYTSLLDTSTNLGLLFLS